MTHEGIEITVVTVTQEDDYSLRVFTLKVRHTPSIHSHLCELVVITTIQSTAVDCLFLQIFGHEVLLKSKCSPEDGARRKIVGLPKILEFNIKRTSMFH